MVQKDALLMKRLSCISANRSKNSLVISLSCLIPSYDNSASDDFERRDFLRLKVENIVP